MGKPAVLFGGPSPEHDISILTGLQASRTLADRGADVVAIYWSKNSDWFEVDRRSEAADFAEGVPRSARPLRFVAAADGGFFSKKKALDLTGVINCCHGGPGEDGSLQGALDLAGVRYSGPGVAGSSLGMDKLAFGEVVSGAGLPSLPRVMVSATSPVPAFPPPYIVKPRFGGSSIGIEVVGDLASARALAESSPHMRQGAVIEPYRDDSRDVNLAIRTYPDLQLSAIEAPTRDPAAGHIYAYQDKYLSGGGLEGSARELPADLPEAVERTVREAAARVVALASVRGIARLDFLQSGEEVYVNEINTIPGSLAAYLWIDPPISRFQLLQDLLTETEKAPARRFSTVGADGTALRSAASIAQKLG